MALRRAGSPDLLAFIFYLPLAVIGFLMVMYLTGTDRQYCTSSGSTPGADRQVGFQVVLEPRLRIIA